MTMKNKGFDTELLHFETLSGCFNNVTVPKGSAKGSDFTIMYEGQPVTFESKTSNTDIFDAGSIACYANGSVYNASNLLTNCHITTIENSLKDNLYQLINYTSRTYTDKIPHSVDVDLYNQVKESGHLIHVQEKDNKLNDIIERSFVNSNNKFIKANYLIIDNSIYLTSNNIHLDPLKLADYGAAHITDDYVDCFTIRTARSGSVNGKASVTMRVQYRLNRELPKTKVTLKDI